MARRKRVDKKSCERFAKVVERTGSTYAEVARECGLQSRTPIGEVISGKIEPSKRMLRWMVEHGASGQWTLVGDGPELWEMIANDISDATRLRNENDKLLKENLNLKTRLDELQKLLTQIYKGVKR